MSVDNIVRMRNFLSPKELIKWGGTSLFAVGLLGIAQYAGLPQIYGDIATSLSQVGTLVQMDNPAQKILDNPNIIRPAAMGASFLAGFGTSLLMMPKVFHNLSGKAVLSGKGNYEIHDGMRLIDKNCGDKRLDPKHQDRVELGAGIMGGKFVRDNIAALAIRGALGPGILQDSFIAYSLGRSIGPAFLSFAVTEISALTALPQSLLQHKGPVLENQQPHDQGCGWSATQSFLKYFLKFSKGHHEGKIKLLDAVNKLDGFLNTSIWEPIVGIPATLTSLFTYKIKPYFGTTSIHEPHTK